MRIFVTGASGFVGSAVTADLLAAGHRVLGMVRSDNGAEKIKALGAEVHRGDIYDLDSIAKGAALADAVIHTAFDHDFSKYKANCETDRKVINTLAATLKGTQKPMVITSGIGLLAGLNKTIEEDDQPVMGADIMPRVASEEAANAARVLGIDTYVLRLPPTVHDNGDHGFVPILINTAKEKGEAAYAGEGLNHWPAVHRKDAAALYRLAIEKRPVLKQLHAVGEEGITFRAIASAIGNGLGLPVNSKTGEAAAAYFGWFAHFAAMDCRASAEKTRQATGWLPKGIGLLKDLAENYL